MDFEKIESLNEQELNELYDTGMYDENDFRLGECCCLYPRVWGRDPGIVCHGSFETSIAPFNQGACFDSNLKYGSESTCRWVCPASGGSFHSFNTSCWCIRTATYTVWGSCPN